MRLLQGWEVEVRGKDGKKLGCMQGSNSKTKRKKTEMRPGSDRTQVTHNR